SVLGRSWVHGPIFVSLSILYTKPTFSFSLIQTMFFRLQFFKSCWKTKTDLRLEPRIDSENRVIPPSIAFWISNCPDAESLKDFMKPLRLLDIDLVILPVNDNLNVELAEGGLHWILLVYYKETNSFFHHDYFMGANQWNARQLYKAVSPFVSDGDAAFRECGDTPQQKNGYDCGVHLLAIAQVICKWFSSGGMKNRDELWLSDVKETVPNVVNNFREEILGLIRRLMSEKSVSK
ncbi:unnamed protein product, partial [Brassica oleracea]